MIQQKKTYRFSDDTIITEQNIRQIGELIALSSVRTRMIHSTRDLYYVFQNLYNVRYSWGISGILNQNSVNSEFVKWRPRISRSPFFAFFMWDYFPLQGNITIFANITPKKFYLFVVLLFISSIDISFNSLTVCNSSVFEFRTTPGSKLSDNTFIS